MNGNQEEMLPALSVSVHFHVPGIDGGVDHNPGAPPELSLGRNVHHHWLGALP